MKELIRPAGEVLLKFLESEQGRKALGKTAEAGMAAAKVAGEGLGKFGLRSGLATESAVLKGAPVARDFAEQFVGRQGVVGKAAKAVSSVTDDQITKAAGTLGAIANPVSQAVAVGAPLALASGMMERPETAYTAAMDTIAAREASAYGIIDAKLQADAARQLGNQELAAQKFQQSLFLQEQRQQHDMMIAQARAEARTPRNQPMSGAGLFDPMAMGQQIYGGTPQY